MLSLVIPVWNDPERLRRLLEQVAGLGVFGQVIVSDDASDLPCDPAALGFGDTLGGAELIHLRAAEQRGAGHARNVGLARVTGSHVLFFDSDDLFTEGFLDLLRALAGEVFDFCIFRHVDSRVKAQGGYGPLESDERLWVEARTTDQPAPLTEAGAQALCRIAAYPWNKIYRTAFLRDKGIRCTEIPVHNDVELHWTSFLKADRIVASRIVGCEHVVEDWGSRLTNRTDADRLRVFEALGNVLDAIDADPDGLRYLMPFTEFYTRLFGWIAENVEPELRPVFAARAKGFLMRRIDPPRQALIALRSPSTGNRINRLLSDRWP
jgi:glycosyltransferase involved in cell wall biosynthesis